MAKVLGIDWGSKRMGLAVGTTEARLASPLNTWPNTPELAAKIKQYCVDEQVATVVVGLPRGMEGQETAQTAEVREFAKLLEKALGTEVKLQDETLTSVANNRVGVDVDAAAAAQILQDYLDSL